MAVSVPAAARTMAIFEVFAREKRDLSNSDMARLMDMPESSCSDLMLTLSQLGYLTRSVRSRRFYPTRRLLVIANDIATNDPLTSIANEAVALLAEQTGETAFFAKLDGDVVQVIAAQQSSHRLRYILEVGDRIPFHTSAVGKAIIGEMPAEFGARLLRLKPLRSAAKASITNVADIEAQIAKFRARGWYEAINEGGEGVAAFAVSGSVGGESVAVSVAGPTDRMLENRDRYLAVLRQVQAGWLP
jgi:IclR family acetate operon transcriptional repressor